MALEIERKFLVRNDAWRAHVHESVPMRQGYLNGEGGRCSIRVRLQGDEGRMNIKAAVVGRSRAEYDYGLPVEDVRAILDTLCVGLVEKTRHHVRVGPHVWEIDVFEGANAGLVVAELELTVESESFETPDWVGEEVTDDRRYYNHALAFHPYQEWTRAPGH